MSQLKNKFRKICSIAKMYILLNYKIKKHEDTIFKIGRFNFQ